MKSIYLVSAVVLFFTATQSCKRTEKGTAETTATIKKVAGGTIEFLEKSHDFGEMEEGTVVKHAFKFKNTGYMPVTIQDVKVQCGCTVASKPMGRVEPGETDEIVVSFDSKGKLGANKKFVTVFSDASNATESLDFTAVVYGKAVK